MSVVGGGGVTFLLSGPMERLAIVPFPTLFGAVQVSLGNGERFALQFGIEYIVIPLNPGGGLLGAGIALVWL